jgi:hypothetical protein
MEGNENLEKYQKKEPAGRFNVLIFTIVCRMRQEAGTQALCSAQGKNQRKKILIFAVLMTILKEWSMRCHHPKNPLVIGLIDFPGK